MQMVALSEPVAGSEVKSSEGDLRRVEDFYDVANNLPTLCWVADAGGNIFWYNRRWYEYTGASPESQQGWGWTSVHDPDRLLDVLDRWKYSIATGEPFEMTFPLKGKDGIFRPFLTRVVPQRDPAGMIVRWLGTNVDISAQVAAEASLRENEALYRSALTAGRLGTWQTDLVSKTRTWTHEGMALFGFTLADGRGHVGGDDDEYWSALHPDDRHLAQEFHELADKQDSLRPSTGWFGRTAQFSGSGATAELSLARRLGRLTAWSALWPTSPTARRQRTTLNSSCMSYRTAQRICLP